MSLADKLTRADQLRGELSALRASTEHANQAGHDAVVEGKVDDEIVMLEREVAGQREVLKNATGSGTVEEAMEAMGIKPAPPLRVGEGVADEKAVDEKPEVQADVAPTEATAEVPIETQAEVATLVDLAPPIGEGK